MSRFWKQFRNQNAGNNEAQSRRNGRLSRRDLLGLFAASWGTAAYASGAGANLHKSGIASFNGSEDAAASPVKPSFEWLRFGEVKPAGWIKAQMLRDLREGSAGHLDRLCSEASSDIFGKGRNRPGKANSATTKGAHYPWYNGETEGNWRSGYFMLAYLTEDPEAMHKADASARHILNTQDKDGYIGVYSPELRYSSSPTNGDMWTQACMLRGMIAYYELTGNQTVLSSVERATHCTMAAYGPGKWMPFQAPDSGGGSCHGLMFTDVVSRLYELTGKTSYRDFGVRIYRDFSAYYKGLSHDITDADLLDMDLPLVGHGAHVTEHLRVPLWAHYATGDPVLKTASENAFLKLWPRLFPGGEIVAMEFIDGRKPDPTYGFCEFCTAKEEMVSLIWALQKTGRAEFGDRIEQIRFNGIQGMRAYDGKGVTYSTRENRFQVAGDLGRRDKFSPTHADVAVCCNPNLAQAMPQYVRGMWMRTAEGGLTAALFGPSVVTTEVKGVRVRIEEKTDYPFSSDVLMIVTPERPVDFAMVIRNPQWSKGTQVGCKGACVSLEDGYFTVRKLWNKGDEIAVSFNESIVNVAASNGEVALQRGPLLYALPIAHVPHVIRTYALPGFADVEYSPAEGANWSYELDATQGKENFGFTAVCDSNADMQYPYDGAPVGLKGQLLNVRTGQADEVSMVPMGSILATLRRVTFPVIFPNRWHGKLCLTKRTLDGIST